MSLVVHLNNLPYRLAHFTILERILHGKGAHCFKDIAELRSAATRVLLSCVAAVNVDQDIIQGFCAIWRSLKSNRLWKS